MACPGCYATVTKIGRTLCRQLIQQQVGSPPAQVGHHHVGDITPDYSSLLPLAGDAPALVAEINLVLAANQLSAATAPAIAGAVQAMPGGAAQGNQRRRVQAALLMVLAAPEYLVQK